MERREKRALAFLLAASLLCLALVGLAAGDPPAERAEALFRAGREEFDRAAAVLGELYQMQEPPIRIMWSLGRQMRQLYSARLAIEKGKGAPYVAGLWGLKPYPADKLMTSARRFSLSWCRRAVVRCGQTDLAMKSTGQDGQQLLTGLLLELAAPSRPAGRQGARG